MMSGYCLKNGCSARFGCCRFLTAPARCSAVGLAAAVAVAVLVAAAAAAHQNSLHSCRNSLWFRRLFILNL